MRRLHPHWSLLALALATSGVAQAQTTVQPPAYVGDTVVSLGSTPSGANGVFNGSIQRANCAVRFKILKRGSTTPAGDFVNPTPTFTWAVQEPGYYLLYAYPALQTADGSCGTAFSTRPVVALLRAIPHDAVSVAITKTTNQAPSVVRFTAQAKDPATAALLAGATYKWTIDGLDGPTSIATTSRAPAYVARSYIGYAGAGQASVTVNLGGRDVAFATNDYSVLPAPPLELTATARSAARWTHAPVPMSVTPKLLGLVPGEFVVESSFALNSAPLSTVGLRPFLAQLDAPGSHNLTGTVRTNKGRTVQMGRDLYAPQPDVPTCSLTAKRLDAVGTLIELTANATSTTGYIARYRWTNGDAIIANTSNRLVFNAGNTTSMPYVTAISDAGLTCSASPQFQ